MDTFLDYYKKRIQPQISGADLFLKTEGNRFSLKKAARLLEIPLEEAAVILQKSQDARICRKDFLELMKRGSSPFCEMFRRQLFVGISDDLTKESVSYIYNLEIDLVEKAAEETGMESVPVMLLPVLFSFIPLADTQYRL